MFWAKRIVVPPWPSEDSSERSALSGRTGLGLPSTDGRSALIRDWDRRSVRGFDVLEAAVTPLSWVKSLSEVDESLRRIRGATIGAVDVETIVRRLRVDGE